MLFATTPKTAFHLTVVPVSLPCAVAGGRQGEKMRTACTHHHWQNSHYFRPIAFLRRFCKIAPGFHYFGFRDSDFFTEQDHQPCVQPPNYLCPSIRGWSSYIPMHGFAFCRLLRLAGRYSHSPPHSRHTHNFREMNSDRETNRKIRK
jgi:hypothetical protein